MTTQEIWAAAMRQSAIDLNCSPADFTCGHSVLVESAPHPEARRYLKLPFFCDLVSYGENVVASVAPEAWEIVEGYLARCTWAYPASCFETPDINRLTEAFAPMGMHLRHMAEYFLPDPDRLRPHPCAYEVRLLTPPEFVHCYTDTWGNALCKERKQLDMLAAGAYDGGTLIGLAGCSADCETMWQIGVDVLPTYRRRGIAAALTSRLALAILERGKVPFYCAAWSNIRSVRNAITSGFVPAWVELTAKPKELE